MPKLLWFHANGRNKSQHCWAQQYWVLLANNAGSVCMGLYMFGAYTLAIYSKYFIVQRGIKSIFSVPAHCQNKNILNRRKTIQQLKTISDVLTAYVFTIKCNSIDLSFQYTRRWQPVQSLQKRSWFTPISCHGIYPLALSDI